MILDRSAVKQVAPDGEYGVSLPGDVLESMLDHCRLAAPLETGGILIGRYSRDLSQACVVLATSAAGDSKRSRVRFIRGIMGLRKLLQKLWENGTGYYLGEWHFHPYAPPTPSAIDRDRMLLISADPRYSCARPILIIIGGDPYKSWTVHFSVYAGESRGLVELDQIA